MKLEPPQLPWREPWRPLSEERHARLADELHREICSPEHVLFGRTVLAIGARRDLDGFLFYLGPTPPSFAMVNLSWSRENSPGFPYTELFQTAEDWVERGLRAAVLEYKQAHKRKEGAS